MRYLVTEGTFGCEKLEQQSLPFDRFAWEFTHIWPGRWEPCGQDPSPEQPVPSDGGPEPNLLAGLQGIIPASCVKAQWQLGHGEYEMFLQIACKLTIVIHFCIAIWISPKPPCSHMAPYKLAWLQQTMFWMWATVNHSTKTVQQQAITNHHSCIAPTPKPMIS